MRRRYVMHDVARQLNKGAALRRRNGGVKRSIASSSRAHARRRPGPRRRGGGAAREDAARAAVGRVVGGALPAVLRARAHARARQPVHAGPALAPPPEEWLDVPELGLPLGLPEDAGARGLRAAGNAVQAQEPLHEGPAPEPDPLRPRRRHDDPRPPAGGGAGAAAHRGHVPPAAAARHLRVPQRQALRRLPGGRQGPQLEAPHRRRVRAARGRAAASRFSSTFWLSTSSFREDVGRENDRTFSRQASPAARRACSSAASARARAT